MKRIASLALLSLFALTSLAMSQTWHIDPDGTGDAATIQAGIGAAEAGDTLLLADGTYTGPGNTSISWGWKLLTIKSESGDPEACIIDCGGSGRAFSFDGVPHGSLIEGITVANGHYTYWDGGAMYVDSASHFAVSDCIFRDNVCEDNGGAVWIDGGDPSFTRCVFVNNSARGAAAVKISGGDYYPHEGRATFTECVFSHNTAQNPAGAVGIDGGEQVFTRCTFSHNSAATGACMDFGSAAPTLDRCIFSYSVQGTAIEGYGDGLVMTCCDVFGNAGGDYVSCIAALEGVDGNFSACPSYCDGDAGDYHLCDGSPCAPGNHPDGTDCGLIGALAVDCACGPSRTEPATWGTVKALYR